VFEDLSYYDCINNPQDPTEKLQIKMMIHFSLDAPQYRMRRTLMSRIEYYGTHIEIVSSYSYLGILLIYNGNFTIARKKLSEQAQKARYALYRKLRNIFSTGI
jgi:hypothetical protein